MAETSKNLTAAMVDVWDAAAAISRGEIIMDGIMKPIHKTINKHVIVIGGRSSGKSSLIRRYLDKNNSDLSATVGIGYTFVKNQRDDILQTEIGHIWEMGSSLQLSEMLEITFEGKNPDDVMILIVIDLSRLDSIFSILGTIIPSLRAVLPERSPFRSITETDKKSFLGNIPIWIIGNKADLLNEMNFELEKRQFLSQTLRQCANFYDAGLLYTSIHQQITEGRLKKIMDNWFFGGKEAVNLIPPQLDPVKGIFMPPGVDTDPKTQMTKPATGSQDDLQSIQAAFAMQIPQKPAQEFLPVKEDLELNLYLEPDVDQVYALAIAELTAKAAQAKKNMPRPW